MKELSYFVCEICNKTHSTREYALMCENKHLKINDLEMVEVRHELCSPADFPSIIKIRDKNTGKELEYHI